MRSFSTLYLKLIVYFFVTVLFKGMSIMFLNLL